MDLLSGDSRCMPHYLYFHPQGDGGQAALVESLGQAFRCLRCLTLVIAGDELATVPLPGPEDEAAARKVVTEIDGMLARHQAPAAARLYREVTGVTWDKAHDTVGRWGQLHHEHKLALIAGGIIKSRGRAT
jgi:hypothetical protein